MRNVNYYILFEVKVIILSIYVEVLILINLINQIKNIINILFYNINLTNITKKIYYPTYNNMSI